MEYVDIIEFRLDYFKHLIINDVIELCRCEFPSIITIRHKNEGGKYYYPDKYRLELFKTALEENANYVDVELNSTICKGVVNYKNQLGNNTKLIISYHNFEKTPNYKDLKILVNKGLQLGDISKIATTVNTSDDILKILRLISRYRSKIVGIGMGDIGRLTRILGHKLGNYLTFISFDNKYPLSDSISLNHLNIGDI